MRTSVIILGLFLLTTVGPSGCGNDDEANLAVPGPGEPGPGEPGPDEPVTIQDMTGKVWDVTYAVRELGFKLKNFNFGMGPHAIRPIVRPAFLEPGDPGYPPPDATFRVLGTTAGDDPRAYAVTDINMREVVNDRVGDLHFAATY